MNKIKSYLGYLSIFFVIALASSVLIGWGINNIYMTRIFPQFTPMNPVTAILFLLIGVALLSERLTSKTIGIRIVGVLASGVGIIMLCKYFFGVDLRIDRIFFESKLGINRMALGTSLNFLLVGISLLFWNKFRSLLRAFIVVAIVISIYALLAYLYNFVGVYGQTLYNPIAIHTATLFLVVSLYILAQWRAGQGKVSEFLQKKGLYAYAIALSILIICLIVVGGIWYLFKINLYEQSKVRFDSQADQITTFVQSRMDLYTNVVYGIQGLFLASDSVQEAEWHTYIQSLDVPANYSGISSISYAPLITPNTVSTFPHTINPFTEKAYYYPLQFSKSFVVPTPTTLYGFDFSSTVERDTALQAAIRTGSPVSTPVILGINTNLPLFSIYAPIYSAPGPFSSDADRMNFVQGIISVSFRLEKIFPDLMKNALFNENIDVEVLDETSTGAGVITTTLAKTENGFIGNPTSNLSHVDTITVGGRTWTIKYYSEVNRNLPAVERYAATGVLVIGISISLLLSLLAATYLRSREKILIGKNIQLEGLVRNFPYGVFIEDENRTVVLSNQKILDLLGVNGLSDEFIGKNVRESYHVVDHLIKDYDKFIKRIEEIIDNKEVVADEKVELTNGNKLSRSYIPLYYQYESHGGVWIYKDITEEEKISQMKSDFVSLVSHQLKTPVAQIKGYVENMIDGLAGATTAKQNEYLGDMLNVANKNSKLIDDLLNVSRIERGVLKVNTEQVKLNELLEDVLNPLRNVAKNKGIKLVEGLPEKQLTIEADGVKLREAIRNIVDNAIKFTDAGKAVQVTAAEVGKYIKITIADQGTGIDPDVQKELFEKNRVWSGKVKASGAGLGLFLSKQFIELMGGTISFSTEAGKGTSFVISLKTNDSKTI